MSVKASINYLFDQTLNFVRFMFRKKKFEIKCVHQQLNTLVKTKTAK